MMVESEKSKSPIAECQQETKEGKVLKAYPHLGFQSPGKRRKTIPQGGSSVWGVSEPKQDKVNINISWQSTGGVKGPRGWACVSSQGDGSA